MSAKPIGARSVSVSSSRATAKGLQEDRELLSEEEDEEDSSYYRENHREGTARSEGSDVGDDTVEAAAAGRESAEEDPITLRDRQSLINVEHPFGLPIWKPALYKKSRSVTRNADQALHSIPSAQAERHLLPGNILWTVLFGWWLSVVCFSVSALLYFVPMGGRPYSTLVFGLGWYVAWPFGKYVEGDLDSATVPEDEERPADHSVRHPSGESDHHIVHPASPSPLDEIDEEESPTPRGYGSVSHHSTITPRALSAHHSQSMSWNPISINTESTPLLNAESQSFNAAPLKSYGATIPSPSFEAFKDGRPRLWLGRAFYWVAFVVIIAPFMLIVCVTCWGLIVTIPMAKLTWALIKYMYARPTSIRFCAAPAAVIVPTPHSHSPSTNTADGSAAPQQHHYSLKRTRLSAGQAAPSGSPSSTVLLCTYRAMGLQYYKYTVGGVNILFVNLLPIVFLVILDGFFLLPWVEERQEAGRHVPGILAFLASRAVVFIMSLASVIPLSYFIGMAVASISAQSSIGMGAVINATFGSIIEILLYAIALTEGKGALVEGSIVGSLLAGVLLMPGMSMCSGALKQKEQKFNAKSAGVTSTMLIMAIIGTLTPTLFYQTYGNFQLICDGCPIQSPQPGQPDAPWVCEHCYYEHPDPVHDPFYQSTVKSLMYFCAIILLLSYLVGLWFSLRTHASQIWQNPRQLMQPLDLAVPSGQNRMSLYHRLFQTGMTSTMPTQRESGSLRRQPSTITTNASTAPSRSATPAPRQDSSVLPNSVTGTPQAPIYPAESGHIQTASPSVARRVLYANPPSSQQQAGYTPLLESVDHAVKSTGLHPMRLPEMMTTDDFTRAVAVATVSALRHQQSHPQSPARVRGSGVPAGESHAEGGDHGGHDAPSWSRTTSASVLLGCTALYAMIAELLVRVVDVVLEGSGIDEKFLGVTLFALVPNTTEFMNAMSFAMNGNIALSMEIGSAYALQVCLLQIPAMVAFSAWYRPKKMGAIADTFTLIFPRWDVITIILSVFLMTYTYIEAKSNYHRGSILIFSYLVLISGFFFAPPRADDTEEHSILQTKFIASSSIQWARLLWSSLWSR